MKTIKHAFLVVGLMILICSSGIGQEQQADKTQAIREQLRQVESTEVNGKSAVIQNLHKRTLLSTRKQLVASIDDDLGALRTMQAAVGNADAETRQDIDTQIRTLTEERNQLVARIEEAAGNSSTTARSLGSSGAGISSEPSGSPVSSANVMAAGTTIAKTGIAMIRPAMIPITARRIAIKMIGPRLARNISQPRLIAGRTRRSSRTMAFSA